MESSPSPLKPEDVNDLLHKFSTESTNVQLMFFAPSSGIRVFFRGSVTIKPDRTLQVAKDTSPSSPRVLCDLSRYSGAQYGDIRAFRGTPAENFFKADFAAALSFTFPDGAVLLLFEPQD